MDGDVERKLLFLYGSQTGTGKEVAEDLNREAKRRWFTTTLLSLSDFDVVCSISCAGLSEAPRPNSPTNNL
jgi:sulfite reductase alpha subunit-like flavoprotein